MQGKVQVVQVSDDTLGWFWGLDHQSKGGWQLENFELT